MNLDLPPSCRKGRKPVPYRCDTCGDRACRKKQRVVCWTHCGDWKPEVLQLEKLPEEAVQKDD